MTYDFGPDGQMPDYESSPLELVTLLDLFREPYINETIALAWALIEPGAERPIPIDSLLEENDSRSALAKEHAVSAVRSIVPHLQALNGALEGSNTVVLAKARDNIDRHAALIAKCLLDVGTHDVMRALINGIATETERTATSVATETTLIRNETLRVG